MVEVIFLGISKGTEAAIDTNKNYGKIVDGLWKGRILALCREMMDKFLVRL